MRSCRLKPGVSSDGLARPKMLGDQLELQSLTAQLALVTAALQLQTAALASERQLHAQTLQENSSLRSGWLGQSHGITPTAAAQSASSNNKVLSLKQVVSLMYKEDASCVLIVRRIQRLGFRSVPVLRDFFQGSLGCRVRKVIVVHSRSKGAADPSKGTVRPANMAFVLMERASDVQHALQFAATNTCITICDPRNPADVFSENVTLHPFVKHSTSSESDSTTLPYFHDEEVFLPSGIL